ncbi:MAG: DUF72 domain-containing protein, partial [Acidimicrobiia bacterium]
GWQYRDWVGRFYPPELPARLRFAHYASVFDTVELNTTFYRLPQLRTVERWAADAPDGFLYATKLGAFGSHRMKLRDPGGWLANHVDRVEALGAHAGPTVVQLPPRWRRDVGRLRAFLDVARTWSPIRWAVELRDPSWVHDDVFAALEEAGAALVLHDLLDQPWLRTTSWTYLRLHGPAATSTPYRGSYGPRRLAAIAERVRPWLAEGGDVYAYCNNDVDAAAIGDAVLLRKLLSTGSIQPNG